MMFDQQCVLSPHVVLVPRHSEGTAARSAGVLVRCEVHGEVAIC